jgi:hypothetical protein
MLARLSLAVDAFMVLPNEPWRATETEFAIFAHKDQYHSILFVMMNPLHIQRFERRDDHELLFFGPIRISVPERDILL